MPNKADYITNTSNFISSLSGIIGFFIALTSWVGVDEQWFEANNDKALDWSIIALFFSLLFQWGDTQCHLWIDASHQGEKTNQLDDQNNELTGVVCCEKSYIPFQLFLGSTAHILERYSPVEYILSFSHLSSLELFILRLSWGLFSAFSTYPDLRTFMKYCPDESYYKSFFHETKDDRYLSDNIGSCNSVKESSFSTFLSFFLLCIAAPSLVAEVVAPAFTLLRGIAIQSDSPSVIQNWYIHLIMVVVGLCGRASRFRTLLKNIRKSISNIGCCNQSCATSSAAFNSFLGDAIGTASYIASLYDYFSEEAEHFCIGRERHTCFDFSESALLFGGAIGLVSSVAQSYLDMKLNANSEWHDQCGGHANNFNDPGEGLLKTTSLNGGRSS